MTKILQPPIQSQNLVDEDGKPTSHQYRWMDGVTKNVGSLNTDVSTLQTTVTNNFANATGTAPLYYCRAWVNFDGTKDTNGVGSASNTNRLILGSGNVTSVLRNGLGVYTVTLTTAMPDTNYAPMATIGVTPGLVAYRSTVLTANTVQIVTFNTAFGSQDCAAIYLTVFR